MFAIILILLLGGGATLSAYELRDYRIPTHRIFAVGAETSVSLRGESHTDDQARTAYGSGWLYGRLGADWLRDSENLSLRFSADADVYGFRDSQHSRENRESHHTTGDYVERHLSPEYRLYSAGILFPTRLPLGIEWSASGDARTDTDWSHSDYRTDSVDATSTGVWDRQTDYYSYYASGETGIGWGRVRDATGLYQAYILEERLRELGRITGELTAGSRRKLADLFYTRPDYFANFERPDRYFWRDIEEILQADPALTGPLDAYAMYRVAEEYVTTVGPRFSGIRLSFMAIGRHSRNIYRYTERSFRTEISDTSATTDTLIFESRKNIRHSDQFWIGPEFEANVPLSLRWQLTLSSNLSRRIQKPGAGFFWANEIEAEWAIFDRMAVSYMFDHVRMVRDPLDRNVDHGSLWFFGHEVNVEYFVENRLSFHVSATQSQEYQDNYRLYIPADPTFRTITRDIGISLGFSYALAGGSRWNWTPDYLPRTSQPRFGGWYYPQAYDY